MKHQTASHTCCLLIIQTPHAKQQWIIHYPLPSPTYQLIVRSILSLAKCLTLLNTIFQTSNKGSDRRTCFWAASKELGSYSSWIGITDSIRSWSVRLHVASMQYPDQPLKFSACLIPSASPYTACLRLNQRELHHQWQHNLLYRSWPWSRFNVNGDNVEHCSEQADLPSLI